MLKYRFILAVVSVAFTSYGFYPVVAQTRELLVASQPIADKPSQVELPESVRNAVLQDIFQQTGLQGSALQIVKAQQQTWSNSCLDLDDEKSSCTQAEVPGWAVLVATGQRFLLYRTDESGSVVKLDAAASQILTSEATTQTASQQQVNHEAPRKEPKKPPSSTQTPTSKVAQEGTGNVKVKGKQGKFSLAILQPSGSLTDAIVRLSVKMKRGDDYLKERFIGDFKYKIRQSSKFVQGLKAGDRVVVRLYDTQNHLIGYSEFEGLAENVVVRLILPDKPSQDGIVRTVYGIDADENGTIDKGTTTYDYFTQISHHENDTNVTFLKDSKQIKVSQFQAKGLATPPTNSVYPSSFTSGADAVTDKTINVFSQDLASALTAEPGKVIEVNNLKDGSQYNVSQLMINYRAVGVSRDTQITFKDVPVDYWAKDYISELAARKIIGGFPDNNFHPDGQVTRGQLAAMMTRAFPAPKIRQAITFKGVRPEYWESNFIRDAYEKGFLEGDENTDFNPDYKLSRLEVLVTLARGLKYSAHHDPDKVLQAYTDTNSIPANVRSLVAGATEQGIVVNYPDTKTLNGERLATRAEVSAIIYQALVSSGDVAAVASPYVVGGKGNGK